MLGIEKIDHIGIRVREKQRATAFYEGLGFALIVDTGFERGRPIMVSGRLYRWLDPVAQSVWLRPLLKALAPGR